MLQQEIKTGKMRSLLWIAAAMLALQACGNADRKDRDEEPTLFADSLSDTTTRAQAATADVDMNGNEKLFVLTAATGGMMEVEAATVVISKTKNPEVKAFAQMMLKDHKKANADLEAIAKGKGMSLPTVLPAEHQKHLDDLKAQSGREFDTRYIKMMIEDHAKTTALFTQGSKLKNPDLKIFASNTLPVIKTHYQSAVAIGKTLNLDNSGNGDDLLGESPNAGRTK